MAVAVRVQSRDEIRSLARQFNGKVKTIGRVESSLEPTWLLIKNPPVEGRVQLPHILHWAFSAI